MKIKKRTLKENSINYDVLINNDEDMKDFVSLIFDNIENISDTIIDYHNKLIKKPNKE